MRKKNKNEKMEKTWESVAEEITKAVTIWENYDWKDSDLW